MTKKDLFEIALKVFGLYLLTIAFDSLIGVIKSSTCFFPSLEDQSRELFFFVTNSFRTIFYIFGFWLLTFKTDSLTKKLIISSADNPILLTIDKTDLLQILFSTSGIIIMFFSISELCNTIIMGRIYRDSTFSEKYRPLIYDVHILISITKGLVGLIFIFASGTLARLLEKKAK